MMIKLKNCNFTYYGNRGMTLEEDINLTNIYYKENDRLCLINNYFYFIFRFFIKLFISFGYYDA